MRKPRRKEKDLINSRDKINKITFSRERASIKSIGVSKWRSLFVFVKKKKTSRSYVSADRPTFSTSSLFRRVSFHGTLGNGSDHDRTDILVLVLKVLWLVGRRRVSTSREQEAGKKEGDRARSRRRAPRPNGAER